MGKVRAKIQEQIEEARWQKIYWQGAEAHQRHLRLHMQREIEEKVPEAAQQQIREAWGSHWVTDEKPAEKAPVDDADYLEGLYGPEGREVLSSL